MLKNIIYKYFLKEIFKTFTLVLFAFTAIAWTVRAVNFLDLIVENAIPFNIYLFYSVLHFFGILTKFIPLAFLKYIGHPLSKNLPGLFDSNPLPPGITLSAFFQILF